MENPAAVHRLKIGVPATVEHASGENAGVETGKWVAEVTQVSFLLPPSLSPFPLPPCFFLEVPGRPS